VIINFLIIIQEKECMKLLDEKLAGGAGAILWCACVN
jgi:hypothetical protein